MPAKAVIDYFEQALRNPPADASARFSSTLSSPDGARADFAVQTAGGRIAAVRYRCTPCVTLVAVCEHLSELMTKADVARALRFRPAGMLALHPEIPPGKQDRVRLACGAFLLALNHALTRRTE